MEKKYFFKKVTLEPFSIQLFQCRITRKQTNIYTYYIIYSLSHIIEIDYSEREEQDV